MILASTSYESVLLALKIAFLVLLYLFIWRIVRTAKRELQAPQESFILRPALAGGVALGGAIELGRLVVAESPRLQHGEVFELGATPLTIGRGGQNDIVLDGDDFASARHARIEPRRDGVWVHDLGSTNGTFVNGAQVDGPQRLHGGDLVRVGSTQLRFEP
jgi:pSer/pThr/pTyr-binding forkhead associated (FHA) protein